MHSGKGSHAAGGQCPRDLASKSTQRYLTGVLRAGRLPKQLSAGGQWPDGVDAGECPVRAVRRLRHDAAADQWTLAYAGATPPQP